MKLYLNLIFLLIFLSKHVISDEEKETDQMTDEMVKQMLYKFEKQIKVLLKSVVRSSLPYILKTNEEVNVSSVCTKSVMRFIQDLIKLKGWTFKMLDSFGKPSAGILRGTQWIQGDYEQCLKIGTTESEIVKGKYCSVIINLPKLDQHILNTIEKTNTSLTRLLKYIIYPFSLSTGTNMVTDYRLDVCIPNFCSENDLRNIANWVLKGYLTADVEFCRLKDEKTEYSVAQIICMTFFAALIVCVIISTVIHTLLKLQIINFEIKGKVLENVVSLSAYTYIKKLFIPTIDRRTQSLSGIKFIQIFVIMYGHVITYLDSIPSVSENVLDLFDFVDHIPIQLASNSYQMIESFFFISGLLTLFLRRNNERSSIYSYIHFLIRRFIRLTVPVFVISATIIIMPLIGDGPHWEVIKSGPKIIEKSWWTLIFHVENFYEDDLRIITHLWFINVLMQLTIITVPILFIQDRWPKVGNIILFILMLTGTVFHITDVMVNKHFPSFGISINFEKFSSYFYKNYIRPYFSHLSSYCFGLYIGYILSKKERIRFGKNTLICLWLGSFTLMGLAVFGLYGYVNEISPNETIVLVQKSLAPFAWTLGIAWICIACITGYGGVVNWFLSLKLFVIFDQLIILIYLLNPLVIFIIYGQLRKAMIYTKMNLWMIFALEVIVTIILSFLYYVFIQSSITFLFKPFLTSKSAKVSSVIEKSELPTLSSKL